MRTSLDLCFCLLTLCGITPVLYGVKVVVEEDSDAVLPCLISTKEDISEKSFKWKKDGQKEKKVFIYDSGIHSNEDEQFKGRVSFFQDQLKNGDASIKIQNTKMADSGNYSCIFPPPQSQTVIIQLVVGASPKPYITTLDQTKDWSLLQCEVRGASPEPKVEWQDSSGNILPAEERQVSERGGRYYVTINITVTKTGRYRCEATQEEISHQIHSETFVQLNEDQSREVKQWRSATIILGVLAAVLPLVVAVVCCRCRNYVWKMLYHCGCWKPFWIMCCRHEITMTRTAPPQYDMKQDDDRRESENRADSEPTERHFPERIKPSSDDPEMSGFDQWIINDRLRKIHPPDDSDNITPRGLDSQDEGLIGNARNSQRGETSSRN